MRQIRIEEKDLDQHIYRIYPMDRFLEMLEKKSLTLVRPKLWKDPMESIIFDASFNIAGQKGHSGNKWTKFFSQCWTMSYESYALWNEYAPLHNGVRVRTTLGKLIKLLDQTITSNSNTWFIGKVDYKPIRLVKKWIGENLPYVENIYMEKLPYGHIYSLFIKLNQYSHENEIRLIYNDEKFEHVNSDIFELNIDPYELFDRLLLDPRMPENIYKIYKNTFINYGFEEKSVIRSGLLTEETLRAKLSNW
ncbi:DUF2971 domain-containing protein [Fulvivirga lutea]|uniref:DUF2971 domain-containing protein n=1 Tax=Fulvivirga lutea TaxID=2810512 RepID=A0A974WE00_9BACT|nr:DUF2971 domain-containing protein [Fulvivirga lutea]QSE96509.1 DUF2971 domain-containing protein [Fulvivirga lutea]